MILNLTDLSDESLQSQLSRQIRAKILSGEFQSGYMLPSIRALAREQKVSVITIQRGYEVLEREGLIHSRRGKGFFVSEVHDNTKKDMAANRLLENLKPLIKTAIDEGMESQEIKNVIDKIINKLNSN
jgi:GntR family transcriptional regulator